MEKRVRRGQVGLLLLVIMGIVIALVMSIASRSLSDTVLSRQERESGAALTVAETGVESALNSLRLGVTPAGKLPLSDSTGLVTGNYQVADLTSYSLFVKEGEMAYLDLNGFSGNLSISWTKKSDKSENLACTGEGSGLSPAAVEVDAMQGTVTSKRSYYNPTNCGAVSGNKFGASLDPGSDYRSMVSYAVPVSTSALGIRPIYAGATITVAGVGLSTQLYLIQSSASGGDAQTQIEVKRGLDGPSSVFDFAVFAGGSVVK